MLFLLKTIPGLEDLALLECEAVAGPCELVEKRPGRILVRASKEGVEALLEVSGLLTGAYLVEALARLPASSDAQLEAAYKAALGVAWERYLSEGEQFAVRSERVGEHSFTSVDLAKVVGQAVADRLKLAGAEPRVHLTSPKKVVVAEAVEELLLLGLSLTGDESLHKRWYRVREHPAALKPPIARAMLLLSRMKDGERLLDPMCGGGTIPIEALLYFETSEAVCNDRSPWSVETAKQNALVAGVSKRLKFLVADVSELPRLLGEESVDRVVTNPPYGIRVGDFRTAVEVLRRLFEASAKLLRRGGTLVAITPHKSKALELGLAFGLVPYCEKWVMHGELDSWIVCFEKP